MICKFCTLDKDRDNFGPSKSNKNGSIYIYPQCKDCKNKRRKKFWAENPEKYRSKLRAYYKANPEKIREFNRKARSKIELQDRNYKNHQLRCKKYGITVNQYDDILNEQNGVCAICGKPPGKNRLAIDHNHNCCSDARKSCGQCVRGLLCSSCNLILGKLSDDTSLFSNISRYLKKISIIEGITYDDVILKPQHSQIKTRLDVDTSIDLFNFKLSHRIVPANMKTVVGPEMGRAIVDSGGLFIMHRFDSYEAQLAALIFAGLKENKPVSASLGVKDESKENALRFWAEGVRIFTIDIAHGDSINCIEMIKWLKDTLVDIYIIAGNIATGAAARRLFENGADCVKVGVGNGSTCTTRIQTGYGVPQMTALSEIFPIRNRSFPDRKIIADGGIRFPADCVKALALSDLVMAGNIFAGCPEAPGNKILINNEWYKEYQGSSTYKEKYIEGVKGLVKVTKPYKEILTLFNDGIKSGCSYQGVNNVSDLQKNPRFIKISQAALTESLPHDILPA